MQSNQRVARERNQLFIEKVFFYKKVKIILHFNLKADYV